MKKRGQQRVLVVQLCVFLRETSADVARVAAVCFVLSPYAN